MEVPTRGGFDQVGILAIFIDAQMLYHLDHHADVLRAASDDDAKCSGFEDGHPAISTSKYAATLTMAVIIVP
jgi:hypothetical protein